MRLLITGFPAFPGRPFNPSQQLVEWIRDYGISLPHVEVIVELLPVEYAGVEREFHRCLEEHRPDVWLAFGVSSRSVPLQLESVGINRDHSDRPDNAGKFRRDMSILPQGPDRVESLFDLDDLQKSLTAAGLQTQVSQNAGTYVCNHLQYVALEFLQRNRHPCRFLFTHLAPNEQGLSVEKLVFALQIMAGWFQNRHTASDQDFA